MPIAVRLAAVVLLLLALDALANGPAVAREETLADTVEGSLPAPVLACAEEKNDERRLACYDREVARARRSPSVRKPLPSARRSPAAKLPAAESSSSEISSTQEELGQFGLDSEPAHIRSNAQGKHGKLSQIMVQVAAYSRGPDGMLVLRMRNGQVWQQSEEGPDLRVTAGDTVTIDKGLLGAYWLWVRSRRGAIKVRRIQ